MGHQPEQREHGPTVPGRRPDRSGKEQVVFILQLALVLSMVSAYVVGLFLLYRLTGSAMWAALAIFPVIAAAWFWGLRPALLAALPCCLLSGLLVSLAQPSQWKVIGQALLVSLAVCLPAGAVVGRLHDLGERLRDQISERKRGEEALRESEVKWRTLALNAPAVILTIDRDGIVQFLNRAVGEYTPEQAVGTSAYDYVSPDQRETMRRSIEQVLETGQPGSYEILGAGPQGPDTAWYETHLGPVLYNDQVTAVTLVSTDITERRKAQEQLRRHADELAQRNEEIKRFAYIVSHDLRAPLVNLKGFAGELRRTCGMVRDAMEVAWPHLGTEQRQAVTRALQEDVPEALGFIDASATRMDQFIGALLRLSRIGHRDLNLTPIDMNALVEETLQTLAHQIEEGQVRVTVAPLPQVVGDRTSMEQIMGNLLSNAVQYLDRDRPGEVVISGERGQEETAFRVRDNGRGIAEDDMDKVFAPFRRAARQDTAGEGMALAYVQALVRRHGGRIWCESELGVGSTFTFTISDHLEKGGGHE